MTSSKVFITGLRNFEIVYVTGSNEVVSRFRSESRTAASDLAKAESIDNLDREDAGSRD